MSPANSSLNPPDTVYSWVGVIMYLTSDNPEKRAAVTSRFQTEYRDVLESVGDEYKAVTHWAKQEMPPSGSHDAGKRLEKIKGR